MGPKESNEVLKDDWSKLAEARSKRKLFGPGRPHYATVFDTLRFVACELMLKDTGFDRRRERKMAGNRALKVVKAFWAAFHAYKKAHGKYPKWARNIRPGTK